MYSKKKFYSKNTGSFEDLFKSTWRWCIEYGEKLEDASGYYSNNSAYAKSGRPNLVEMCGNDDYAYLNLIMFMFFYSILRCGLTPKLYTSTEGGFLSSAINYVIFVLEEIRQSGEGFDFAGQIPAPEGEGEMSDSEGEGQSGEKESYFAGEMSDSEGEGQSGEKESYFSEKMSYSEGEGQMWKDEIRKKTKRNRKPDENNVSQGDESEIVRPVKIHVQPEVSAVDEDDDDSQPNSPEVSAVDEDVDDSQPNSPKEERMVKTMAILCGGSVAERDLKNILKCLIPFFNSGNVIALVGNDSYPCVSGTSNISVEKLMDFIYKYLSEHQHVGLSLDAKYLQQIYDEGPASHAVTAVKIYLNEEEVLKLIKDLLIVVPWNLDTFIENFRKLRDILIKNSWKDMKVKKVSRYDMDVQAMITLPNANNYFQVFPHKLGIKPYKETTLAATTVNAYGKNTLPIYTKVLKWLIKDAEWEHHAKELFFEEKAKYDVLLTNIEPLSGHKSRYLAQQTNEKNIIMVEEVCYHFTGLQRQSPNEDLEKIIDVLEQIITTMQWESEEEKLQRKIDKVNWEIKEATDAKGLLDGSMNDENDERIGLYKLLIDINKSTLIKMQEELKLVQENVDGLRLSQFSENQQKINNFLIDYSFAMKYAINTGNVDAFKLLLECFGPTILLVDDYELLANPGDSIYCYICSSVGTSINSNTIFDILETLFEYCNEKGYKIRTAYKVIYEPHFTKLLMRSALLGFYKYVMDNAILLNTKMDELYKKYDEEHGLFKEVLGQNGAIIKDQADAAAIPPKDSSFGLSIFGSSDPKSGFKSDSDSVVSDSVASVGGGVRKTRRKKRLSRVHKNTRRKNSNTYNNYNNYNNRNKKTRAKKRKIRNKRTTRRL